MSINWSDYIDPGVLEDFTRETGIKVVYDTYDSNEMLESHLLAGRTGYDIVVPSATFLERQIKAGVLQPIDRSKLANAGNIWSEIDGRLSRYDPGSAHAVNYMWYTTGVAYNVAKIKERLGKPITSWDQVLKPEALKKLADCGVYVLDSPEDIFAITLNYLKLDPNSKTRGRSETRGRSSLGPAALHQEIPLVRIYQRARQWRHLPCDRLGGRQPPGAQSRARSRLRRRHRLCDSARGHADVDGQFRHSRRRAACEGSLSLHRLHAAARHRRAQHQGHEFRQWRRRPRAR